MTLGERLKKIRGGLGQSHFAKKIGVSQSSLSLYEIGSRVPDATTLGVICNDFRISPEWLLMGTGPMYRDEQVGKTGDTSPVSPPVENPQYVENTRPRENKTGDMSPVLGLQNELMKSLQKSMEFQERLMTTTQENADLRVQAERHLSRIRELERENAEIPALKARIAELERELSERPKLPKTVPVDVSAKSKPTSAHGAGTDTAVVPGAGAGISGVGALGAVVRGDGE